jgi:hypothetical protein
MSSPVGCKLRKLPLTQARFCLTIPRAGKPYLFWKASWVRLISLWEDAVERHETLPLFGLVSEPNLRMLTLLESTGMAVQALVTHMRSSFGANVPRGLAELACFRSRWSARLSAAGFGCTEVPLFLGCSAPAEQRAQSRAKDAGRKALARARVRVQSTD